MKRGRAETCGVAVLLALFATGCVLPPVPGILSVADLTPTTQDQAMGTMGTVVIQEGDDDAYTAVGQTAYATLPALTNEGETDLVIRGMRVYKPSYDANGTITDGGFNQDVFALVEGTRPDLPLVLSPGQSLTGLMVSFAPRVSGPAWGVLSFETDGGQATLGLEGTGVWNLTLIVAAAAGGKITAPVEVLENESVLYRCATDTVEVRAETTHALQLTELGTWITTGGASAAPNDQSVATLTVTDHGSVEAVFVNPYVLAWTGTYGGSLNTALAAFVPGTHKGVVVGAGTWTVTGTLPMIAGVLRGGYLGVGADRRYETPEDRANVTYRTVLAMALDSTLNAGAAADETSLIEGFVIQGAAGADALTFGGGAATTVRACDITAAADRYAIYADGAGPTVESCYIYGSAATGDAANPDSAAVCLVGSNAVLAGNSIAAGTHGVRTVGVFLTQGSAATLSNNVITGGATDIDSALSVGVYVDFVSDPVLEANTITGGTSSGSGGQSTAVMVTDGSSPVIRANDLDGGTGIAAAFAVYLYGSGWPVILGNQLHTSATEGTAGYGVYAGHGSRIETLADNHFSLVPSGLLYRKEMTGEVTIITTVEELNEIYVPEPSDEEPENTAE